MPRLVFFLPCEKAIIDKETNGVSLIHIIQAINVPKPPGEDAGAAVNWAAVALWQKTPEDTDKVYEQRTNLLLPNRKETAESIVRFDFSTFQSHRNIVRINGFPVGLPGIYTLNLFLRESGSESWTLVADYKIPVEHISDESLPKNNSQ